MIHSSVVVLQVREKYLVFTLLIHHGSRAAATKKKFRLELGAAATPLQASLPAGQPLRGVHNGATARRRHQGAAREGAPRLGDVLGVLLPYGHERPQRRPRSRGLGPR